jgi:hypothetical protein
MITKFKYGTVANAVGAMRTQAGVFVICKNNRNSLNKNENQSLPNCFNPSLDNDLLTVTNALLTTTSMRFIDVEISYKFVTLMINFCFFIILETLCAHGVNRWTSCKVTILYVSKSLNILHHQLVIYVVLSRLCYCEYECFALLVTRIELCCVQSMATDSMCTRRLFPSFLERIENDSNNKSLQTKESNHVFGWIRQLLMINVYSVHCKLSQMWPASIHQFQWNVITDFIEVQS